MTKEIELTQGRVTLVDDDDYEYLSKYKWHVAGNTRSDVLYARRRESVPGSNRLISMHREIMNLKHGDGKQIDHINRNGLDNRRSNLRIASPSTNLQNCGMYKNNVSGYTGVSWHKVSGKWRASIASNGKSIFLGLYTNKQDAIDARWRGELTHWDAPKHRKYANVPNSPI